MADSLLKYVYLSASTEIKINADGDLELYFYTPDNALINGGDPLILHRDKPNRGFRLMSSVVIAGFSEKGFTLHKDTLGKLAPGVTWDTAEVPKPYSMPLMNPIKPPVEDPG